MRGRLEIPTKRSILYIGSSLVVLFLMWIAMSSDGTAQQVARDPKALFVETFRCSTCHSVASAGVEAKARSASIRGSDLSGYKAKPGVDPVLYLRKKARLEGETHRVEFLGTDDELRAILDWLGSLEARPTKPQGR